MLVGQKGIYTVAPPYSLSAIEYEVIAIQSLSALITMGLDPYVLIYQPAGLDQTFYEKVSRNTQVYLLKSSQDIRYLPVDSIIAEDTTSYVNYVDMAIALQLGAHPVGTTFANLTTTLISDVSKAIGVTPVITQRNVSQITQLTVDKHTQIIAERKAKIDNTLPDDILAARELEIRNLRAKLNTLEQFLVSFSKSCTTPDCRCSPSANSYADDIVFYQYSLGDYVIQAARGDIFDMPINNAFIQRLHILNNPQPTVWSHT